MDPHDLPFRDPDRIILQDLFLFIGKVHIVRLRIGKGDLFHAGYFLHLGRFFQNGKNPLPAGKGLVQVVGQIGEGRHRAEGSHHGNGPHQHPGQIHAPCLPQPDHQKEHGKGKQQDCQVRHRSLGRLQTVQFLLHPAQFIGALRHVFPPFLSLSVLNGLIQPPEGIQDKAVQIPETGAEFHPFIRSSFSEEQRDSRSHSHISDQR